MTTQYDEGGRWRSILEGRLEFGLMPWDERSDIDYSQRCTNGNCMNRADGGMCERCSERRKA